MLTLNTVSKVLHFKDDHALSCEDLKRCIQGIVYLQYLMNLIVSNFGLPHNLPSLVCTVMVFEP